MKKLKAQLENDLNKITYSKAYKFWQKFNSYKKSGINLFKQLSKIISIFKGEGFIGVYRAFLRRLELNQIIKYDLNLEYKEYWEKYKKIQNSSITINLDKLPIKPLISIITPVYNTPETLLKKMIESILKQEYTNWELLLINDHSTDKNTLNLIHKYKRINEKIKIINIFNKKTIGYASNVGIKYSKGSYLYIVDSDDEIEKNTLAEFIITLNNNKKNNIKIIYTDEDRPNLMYNFVEPFIKPDWSPHLLLSNMYMTHFLIEKKLFYKAGKFPENFHTSHDYDLILRASEIIKSNQIFHIPKILYHWNNHGAAMSHNKKIKKWTYEANKKILYDALKRRGFKGLVESGIRENFWRIRPKIKGNSKVSIIIPNKNSYQMFKECIESILNNTTYPYYEIIIIDNGSDSEDIKTYYKEIQKNKIIKIYPYNKPFNYSKINNFAARKATGSYLILLNNDTKVIKTNPDWITSMLEFCQFKEVGAVGCLLLFPDNTIQHMGVVTGWEYNKVAGHVCGGKNPDMLISYQNNPYTIRNWSAVTAACMMTKKNLYLKEKGLNESNLTVAFNDVDYCLRLKNKGYFIVYTPYAKLYHYQSVLRGIRNEDKERNFMLKKYGSSLYKDPYYSTHCRLDTLDFRFKLI